MKKFAALLAVALAVAVAGVASASPAKQVMLGAKLTAKADNATSSHGKGSFTATLTGNKLSWHLTFSHLTGSATAAHIHLGKAGVAGNVLIPLCTPCKPTSMGTVKLNAMQIRDATKLATYVNVHTAKYANGEIRGQIAAH
jgi:hypothetical protein